MLLTGGGGYPGHLGEGAMMGGGTAPLALPGSAGDGVGLYQHGWHGQGTGGAFDGPGGVLSGAGPGNSAPGDGGGPGGIPTSSAASGNPQASGPSDASGAPASTA